MKTLVSLALLLAASAWAAQKKPVELLSAATVARERVYLSDLLPPGTRGQLRDAAEEIALGRSPQPGSFRVFGREQLRHLIGAQIEVEVPEQVVVRRPPEGADTKVQTTLPRRIAPPLVRPRVPASLVIESEAIRIQLRVVPLRAAALGETVRVLDPVTHRVLLAQVTGERLLKLRDEQTTAERGRL